MASRFLPGAPFVHYQNQSQNQSQTQNQVLAVESVNLADLAQQYQTPLMVYSKGAMLAALQAYQKGFSGRDALICYAMKANSSLAVLQLFAQYGCGFDIVSGGELARALQAGANPRKIIFSGVGKTRDEMRQALLADILCFNVESVPELDVLNEVALSLGRVAAISLRVNPDVDAKTHPYISTGLKGNKFGIAHDLAVSAYRYAASLKGLRVVGIDCHIGSQITEVAPYLDAMDRVLDLVQTLEQEKIAIDHIDFGGGLGINYSGLIENSPPQADDLWRQLLAKMDARGLGGKKLLIEPGRSLVGNAGVCVTQVLFTKDGQNGQIGQAGQTSSETKNFCIVDAAMNDLPRPAMYQAFHSIVPCQIPAQQVQQTGQAQKTDEEENSSSSSRARLYDVVGPVCESGDWLGRDRLLDVKVGDLLAVLSTGAYCMAMASNYNSRGRAAEILVDGAQTYVIRRRETLDDQIRLETLL